MRRFPSTRCALWAAALVLLALAPARAQGTAAVVTDARGAVQWRVEGQPWQPGRLLTRLPVGSEVQVGQGGQATLSFARGGTRVDLAAGASVRVELAGVKRLAGSATAIREVRPSAVATARLPAGLNLDRMGGLRRNPKVVNFTDPGLAGGRLVVTWSTAPGVREVQVSVEELPDDGPPRRVFKDFAPASAGRLEVGLDLKPGAAYSLILEGYGEDGRPVEAQQDMLVQVLDTAAAADLAAAEAAAAAELAARPEDATPLVLLVDRYLEAGLLSRAYATAKRLAALRPGDPLPYRVMAAWERRRQNTVEAEALEARAREGER